MMSFHQSSQAQYSENKAGGFPSGINTSNKNLSPYYDRAQLLVSQSASKKNMQRLQKEQHVCAVIEDLSVDMGEVKKGP
jgi:hypothetical protein